MNRDAFTAAQPATIDTGAVQREAPRYLFFAGDLPDSIREDRPAGGLDLGSPVIKPFSGTPGFLHRCVITPCSIATALALTVEIPEGMPRVKVEHLGYSDKLTGERRDMAAYPIYPGAEVDRLVRSYQAWGVVDIQCLAGKPINDVEAMNLNQVIFPDWPKLPELNSELITYLITALASLSKSATGPMKLIVKVVEEILDGVRATDRWMRDRLEESHSQMALPSTDSHHKSVYDKSDLHFLTRTGMQRRDQFQRTIVDTQALLAKAFEAKPEGLTLDGVREILQQQQDQFRQILEVVAGNIKPQVSAPATAVEDPPRKGTK